MPILAMVTVQPGSAPNILKSTSSFPVPSLRLSGSCLLLARVGWTHLLA